MTASAIYEGWVAHRRLAPIENRFRYRVWMPLLDLDELPEVLDRHPLWSARRPAPLRFRAGDFLGGDLSLPLAARARELVGERLGRVPAGPVRLLASPRSFGIGFNPVSFLYLHDEDGALAAVIAEVTNTPWGERHRYVAGRAGDQSVARARFRKRLHVSPFMAMEQTYELEASSPGTALTVSIRSEQDEDPIFEATLALRRRELTRRAMTRALVRYPPSAPLTLTRIYANALRLRLRGLPSHSHPARRRRRPEITEAGTSR
jgi:DUF1365 family protein